uniref:DNA/RNA non-specific endonuclease n=1 Tax=Chilo suppressalis TaxID=168631 RepID=A0A219LVU2_CHISP|nr:DNA/RNA non-specific endonuclease [Chilo suppressalis]
MNPWYLTSRVGYKLRKTFFTLYEACFDKSLMSTLYVVHELSPDNKHQPGQRPNFVEGNLFGKVRMAELYKLNNQVDRLNNVLGANMSQVYLTKKQFLSRGHLAPRADFPLRAAQLASFHYVNTAPQWMRGNAGDWAALEEALRRRVQKLSRPVTVYTGTHGVVTLADNTGRMKPIYLDVDANNNELVPVPLYSYKLVHDPKTKRATAFITINSSYYSDSMLKNLTFCDDICDGNSDFNWLKWRANDGTFSFCCSYEQFVEEVGQLPRLHVAGVFY